MDTEIVKKTKRSKKILNVTGIVIGSLVALCLALFAGLLIYINANEDAIKKVIISQLNTHMDADITITSADIEITKYFPDISVQLSGTTVSPPGYSPDLPPLAQAEYFYVRIDLLSILRKEYHIKAFSLEEAQVVLYRSKKGETNYEFLTPDSPSDSFSSGIPEISVPCLQLINVGIRYIDEEKDFHFSGDILKSTLNLKARDSIIAVSLEIMAKALIPGIEMPEEYTHILLDGAYKPHHEQITISGGRIQLDDMTLYLSSETISLKHGKGYNINIEANDLGFQKVIDLMPEKIHQAAQKYNPHGKISFTGELHGSDLYSRFPSVKINAHLKVDTLYPLDQELKLHSMTTDLEAEYDPEDDDAFALKLTNLKSKAQDNTIINGWVVIRSLKQQFINTSLEGTINLADVAYLLPENNSVRGIANINLKYKGKISGFKDKMIHELESSESSLNVDLKDSEFVFGENHTLKVDAFQGFIMPHKADIKNLTCEINDSDAGLSGVVENYFNLFKENRSPVTAKLTVKSTNLNLENILAVFNNGDKEKPDSPADNFFYVLPSVDADLELIADNLLYDNINLTNIRLLANSDRDDINLKSLRLWSCGGSLQASGKLLGYSTASPRFKSTIKGKGVDISSVFSIFKDFGLTGLTHKNISGSLTTDIFVSSTLLQGFKLDMSTFIADANLIINDGALTEFGTLEEFSGFLGLDDLSDIQFETLENQILIKDETIIIPEMEIKNNVLDLNMKGRQSFKGEMDYNIDLALAELLSGKYQDRNKGNEFGIIQEDGRKGTRLYIMVTGTTEEPKFKYDTPKVRKEISEELRKEKEDLINLISADNKNDSISVPEESDKFKVNWDEQEVVEVDSTSTAPEKKVKKGKKFEIDW